MSIFRTKHSGRPRARQLAVPFSMKEAQLKEDGSFQGYGSVFGTVDSYNEIVMPGAFKKSLKDWEKRGSLPAMLWQHKSDMPIGAWTRMEEDSKGLYVEGQLAREVEKGREAHVLMKMGAIGGLSIGFAALEWTTDKKAGTVALDVIDLWEVSAVTFPANRDARIDTVKAALEHGDILPIADFEAILREAGYSKADATEIASHGYRKYLAQREAVQPQTPDFSGLFDNLKNRYTTP